MFIINWIWTQLRNLRHCFFHWSILFGGVVEHAEYVILNPKRVRHRHTDWLVLSLHMQVILDSILPPGLNPYIDKVGKGEFRDWTSEVILQ